MVENEKANWHYYWQWREMLHNNLVVEKAHFNKEENAGAININVLYFQRMRREVVKENTFHNSN